MFTVKLRIYIEKNLRKTEILDKNVIRMMAMGKTLAVSNMMEAMEGNYNLFPTGCLAARA